ncbi:MAG: TlpA disulfide reductase family protein [Rubrivivax sp.]|nr:TlpA disulfide reductase family protein [Rubrivivax sp.]
MLSISLGPIALPLAPVLLLLAVWAASWLASRLASRAGDKGGAAAAGNAVIHAALLGLLAARLVHLALNADLYLDAPWFALDLRDGGWHALSGAITGAAWLAWRGLRAPALRRPLAGGVLAGTAIWSAAFLAAGLQGKPEMPALTLTDFASGAPVDLRQAAGGRPVVVNLWASWCGPCRTEMPTLAAAQQRESTIGFLFVNQGESSSAVRAYLTDQNLPLREVLLDAGSRLGPAVGSRGLPTTLFYDARGRQVGVHFGMLNSAALQARLRALRAAP